VARFQSWEAGYGAADAEAFLAEMEGAALGRPGAWMQLAAVELDGGALVGDCAVHVLHDPPDTAEVGVTLAPGRQGRGLAAEALGAVLDALFARHGLHRAFAQADDRNVSVHRLLERLGFRCEARHVEADWFKGEWATLRVYALLAREWRARGH
jgi:RimJ/RimL family protein N-acetyltransferase